MIGSLFYVPVRTAALITGGRVEWNAKTMTANLIADVAGPLAPTPTGAIVADPPKWAWKRVQLHGEYTDWQTDPFDPATTHGPPVTRDDWTMRDATGALYCDSAYYRMGWGGRFPAKLDPTKDLGRRLEVVGTVELTKDGWPYLHTESVTVLTDLDGTICYLTTDRDKYQPGDTIKMQMLVRDPAVMLAPGEWEGYAGVLHFNTTQQYDFTVSDAQGKGIWRWSADRMFAHVLTEKALDPGGSYTVSAQWTVPATLPAGVYRVSGLINRDVRSYVKRVGAGEK
jgi:hypothetical protein